MTWDARKCRVIAALEQQTFLDEGPRRGSKTVSTTRTRNGTVFRYHQWVMAKRLSIRLMLIALLTIVSLVSSSAQNPAPPGRAQTTGRATPPSTVPKVAVETFTLDNGLQVIVSRRPELPVVAVNTWYHVGPANEAVGRTGFAHLFEHMMFQQSKHVPEDSYFQMLESAGASDINGSTNFDFTNYYQTLPANQVELALWLESDRMGYLL